MSLLVSWRKLLSAIVGRRYRPELHYMRGPGPKWLERHGRSSARSTAFNCGGVRTPSRSFRLFGAERGNRDAKQGQYSDAPFKGFILDTNAQDGITNAQINRRRPKPVALGNIIGKECGATDRQ